MEELIIAVEIYLTKTEMGENVVETRRLQQENHILVFLIRKQLSTDDKVSVNLLIHSSLFIMNSSQLESLYCVCQVFPKFKAGIRNLSKSSLCVWSQ